MTEHPPQNGINHVRQILNYQNPRRSYPIRRDEPSFGSIIYTDNLQSLEALIMGSARHPFDKPDGNFLIILTLQSLVENWQNIAASLLETLWNKWHIMHAALLSTCDSDQVSDIRSLLV